MKVTNEEMIYVSTTKNKTYSMSSMLMIVCLSILAWFSSFIVKSKITKILNLKENLFGKSIITWQNQITKRIKNGMDKNCNIPDLVQAFSNVENGGLNLVL